MSVDVSYASVGGAVVASAGAQRTVETGVQRKLAAVKGMSNNQSFSASRSYRLTDL